MKNLPLPRLEHETLICEIYLLKFSRLKQDEIWNDPKEDTESLASMPATKSTPAN